MLASWKSTEFYDCHWRRLPFGSEVDVSSLVGQYANIGPRFLQKPQEACIAAKMSWLSCRETTFDEDMAYCMVGIFGVHLQVSYGEGGENAFRRLQMALIEDHRYANDESIFAWTGIPAGLTACGLLAPWPSHFADSGAVKLVSNNGSKSLLAPRIPVARDGVIIQIPTKHMHINNGADMNIAEAARSNCKEILLNVQDENTADQQGVAKTDAGRRESRFRLFTKDKGKQDGRSKLVSLTLVKNTEKQWRRQPTVSEVFNKDAKSSSNSMPLFVPHQAVSDTAPDLRMAKRGGFMDGMSAAIDAQKGR